MKQSYSDILLESVVHNDAEIYIRSGYGGKKIKKWPFYKFIKLWIYGNHRQARMLAINEDIDVDFHVSRIENITSFGNFDIIICIAVVTEVENVLSALRSIRDITNETAILEMDLSRPLIYVSANKHWWKKDSNVSRLGRVAEMHRHTHFGWVYTLP